MFSLILFLFGFVKNAGWAWGAAAGLFKIARDCHGFEAKFKPLGVHQGLQLEPAPFGLDAGHQRQVEVGEGGKSGRNSKLWLAKRHRDLLLLVSRSPLLLLTEKWSWRPQSFPALLAFLATQSIWHFIPRMGSWVYLHMFPQLTHIHKRPCWYMGPFINDVIIFRGVSRPPIPRHHSSLFVPPPGTGYEGIWKPENTNFAISRLLNSVDTCLHFFASLLGKDNDKESQLASLVTIERWLSTPSSWWWWRPQQQQW